jgi:hypothetical protein
VPLHLFDKSNIATAERTLVSVIGTSICSQKVWNSARLMRTSFMESRWSWPLNDERPPVGTGAALESSKNHSTGRRTPYDGKAFSGT